MLEEQKLEVAAPAEEKDEREKWLLRLEAQIRATEENEKSLVKYGENLLRKESKVLNIYSQLAVDLQQQQLQNTRDQSYQILKHTFAEGRIKFLNPSQSVANLTGKYQIKIAALEEAAKKLSAEKAGYQQQIEGIKKEQRELISESLDLFSRHEAQLTELLEQLVTQSIRGPNLRRCQNSVKDANKWTKRLTEENNQVVPNFKLCKEYIIEAGKAYQVSYDYILELTNQQNTRGGNGPENTQVAGGDINVGDAQINADGDVHVGNNIIIHIHQTATQGIADITPQIQAAQKKLEDVDTKYETLQRQYQNNEQELILKNAELEKQRSDFLVRNQTSSSQLEKVQAEKIAAEQRAAEQTEKTNEILIKTKQEAVQQAAAAAAEAAGRNEEIEKLKIKLQTVESAAAKAETEKRATEDAQVEQAQKQAEAIEKYQKKAEQMEKSNEATVEQIAKVEAEKTALAQHIAEQAEKVGIAKSEAASLKKEIDRQLQVQAEVTAKQSEEMEKLKADLAAAKEAAKEADVEKCKAELAAAKQAVEEQAKQLYKAGREQCDRGCFTAARECFERAAKQHYPPAYLWLYQLSWDGSVPYDAEQALHWEKLASQHFAWFQNEGKTGTSEAQFNLALCYDNGLGVAKDLEEVVRWSLLAADQGLAAAQVKLGDCYQDGDGVAENLIEAVRWWRLAARQGNARAQAALRNCDRNDATTWMDLAEVAQKWIDFYSRRASSQQITRKLPNILLSDAKADEQAEQLKPSEEAEKVMRASEKTEKSKISAQIEKEKSESIERAKAIKKSESVEKARFFPAKKPIENEPLPTFIAALTW